MFDLSDRGRAHIYMVCRTGKDQVVEDMHVTKSEETRSLNPNSMAHTHAHTETHLCHEQDMEN